MWQNGIYRTGSGRRCISNLGCGDCKRLVVLPDCEPRRSAEDRRGSLSLKQAIQRSFARTDYLIAELTRLQRPTPLRSLRAVRLGMAANKIATEMLLITNPESDDDAAQDKYAMEADLLSRPSRIGVAFDMEYVRRHHKGPEAQLAPS